METKERYTAFKRRQVINSAKGLVRVEATRGGDQLDRAWKRLRTAVDGLKLAEARWHVYGREWVVAAPYGVFNSADVIAVRRRDLNDKTHALLWPERKGLPGAKTAKQALAAYQGVEVVS